METPSGLVAGDQIDGDRDYQEDVFELVNPTGNETGELLLVVADGMGGYAGGAQASELAVTTFVAHFKNSEGEINQRLRKALDAANAAIAEGAAENPLHSKMGCTLLACLITDGKLHWLSVGDSLLWLLRDQQMTRLNADHSMRPVLEGLVNLGRMTMEELAKDNRINQLRSALIGKEIMMVDQDKSLDLAADDQLILASDGLETLSTDDIGAICQAHPDPTEAVAALLAEVDARQHPGQDNTTVTVYRHTSAGLASPKSPVITSGADLSPRSGSKTGGAGYFKFIQDKLRPARLLAWRLWKERPWKKR